MTSGIARTQPRNTVIDQALDHIASDDFICSLIASIARPAKDTNLQHWEFRRQAATLRKNAALILFWDSLDTEDRQGVIHFMRSRLERSILSAFNGALADLAEEKVRASYLPNAGYSSIDEEYEDDEDN